MRQKASKGQKVTNNAEKIVRRELKKVLTNGTGAPLLARLPFPHESMLTGLCSATVSDATFLAGDDASHCIAIKVRPPSSLL